jgi:hypothetical protein
LTLNLPCSVSRQMITSVIMQVEQNAGILRSSSTYRCKTAINAGHKKNRAPANADTRFSTKGLGLAVTVFAGRTHFLQIFINEEQGIAAVAHQHQFIQYGLEQLLFFVLLGNIPLQEVEG